MAIGVTVRMPNDGVGLSVNRIRIGTGLYEMKANIGICSRIASLWRARKL